MKIKYLGHSCFELNTECGNILVDPFLVQSPNYLVSNLKNIFVTHGHSDHLGSAVELSRTFNAEITAIFELANYCAKKGARANGIGLGSWITYPWGKAIAVPAFHSSSLPDGSYGGNPCGFIFSIGGIDIYHAGDTSLNSEMKVIKELYHPSIAILPIGGHYTMDIDHAVNAAEWIGAEIIIPMHYNTFDAILVDVEHFRHKIQSTNKTALILGIGESKEF